MSEQIGVLIWDRLERIRSTISLSEKEFADRLHLTLDEYRHKRSTARCPSLLSCDSFFGELDLSLERVYEGDIDFDALSRRWHGDKGTIRDRYLPGAYSRMRTSMAILEYADQLFGWQCARALLRSLQLNPSSVTNPDALVNINLVTDLCDALVNRGFPPWSLHSIGLCTMTQSVNNPIRDLVSDLITPREVYERTLTSLIGHFEYNHVYRIEALSDTSCIVSMRQSERVKDELRTHKFGSSNSCLYRTGSMSSVPTLIGLPLGTTTEIACVHRGDRTCVFEVNFAESFEYSRKVRRIH